MGRGRVRWKELWGEGGVRWRSYGERRVRRRSYGEMEGEMEELWGEGG